MRKRALVAGGAGFVGSHLCERLLDRGLDVVCLDNFVTGSPRNVAHLIGRDGFEFVKADVSDFISIPGRLDYVLHFASPASPVDYAQLAVQTLKAGSLGTIAHLCESFGVDARQVLPAIGADHRIGSAFLQPGLGWGGSCPA